VFYNPLTQVDWHDSKVGTPAAELRLGLECCAKVDLPEGEEPPRASKGVLENLLGVLQAEEIGTSNALKQLQDTPELDAKQKELKRVLQARRKQHTCIGRLCCWLHGLFNVVAASSWWTGGGSL
jgi:hypothetical protein